MKAKNPGALSGRTWTSILLFGLIGQIAWVVENMYFSRLCKMRSPARLMPLR